MGRVLTDQEEIAKLKAVVHELRWVLCTVLRDSDNSWHREMGKIIGRTKLDHDLSYVRKAKERGVDLG